MNGNGEVKRFTSIAGFRRTQFLPRLGKIRLGIKVKTAKGTEYPKETDYFVCPPEVIAVYGEKPTSLDILLPSEDPNIVVPYCYKKYGSNQKLHCKGNGEIAIGQNEKGEMVEKKCPCEDLKNKKCSQRGHLMVIIPRVSLGGVYQIDTGSTSNINKVMDAMLYWQTMAGHCKGIPLTIERVPEKLEDPISHKMNTHYLFKFSSAVNIDNLNKAIENKEKILSLDFKIEPPIEDGKLDDTPIISEGEIIDEADKKTAFEITDDEIKELTEAIKKLAYPDERKLKLFKAENKIKKWKDLTEEMYAELRILLGIQEIPFGE